MPRKTKEEAMKTRQSILDSALTVFYEKGYRNATMSQIAGLAGCTRGAVYWHFKDKAEVFIALAEDMEGKANRAAEKVGNDIWGVDQLIGWVEKYLQFMEGDEQYQMFYEMVFFRTEWSEEIRPVLDAYQKMSVEMERFIVGAIGCGMGEEVARDLGVERFGMSVAALMEGMLAKWLLDKNRFLLSESVVAMLKFYLGCYGSK